MNDGRVWKLVICYIFYDLVIQRADVPQSISEEPRVKSRTADNIYGIFFFKQSESVLVGDSIYDENGADAAGIGFIAVIHGFGFYPNEEIQEGHIAAADYPEDLLKILL